MKRILAPIVLALTFSVMFSSTSSAGWTKVSEGVDGSTFYVDFERIRKHDGYVYYWNLTDYKKAHASGIWSSKVYYQGDCKLFRIKRLSSSYHTQLGGDGTSDITHNVPDKEWTYPSPNSADEVILKEVCNQ